MVHNRWGYLAGLLLMGACSPTEDKETAQPSADTQREDDLACFTFWKSDRPRWVFLNGGGVVSRKAPNFVHVTVRYEEVKKKYLKDFFGSKRGRLPYEITLASRPKFTNEAFEKSNLTRYRLEQVYENKDGASATLIFKCPDKQFFSNQNPLPEGYGCWEVSIKEQKSGIEEYHCEFRVRWGK